MCDFPVGAFSQKRSWLTIRSQATSELKTKGACRIDPVIPAHRGLHTTQIPLQQIQGMT